jgi:ketosteroid isomerase-like protein
MQTYDEAFVKRFMAPWNEHDVDGAMVLMTDDCIWEVTRGAEAHGAHFAGTEAVRAAIARLFKTMPDIRYDLVHSSFGPDLVVLELLAIGTPADGRTARFQACDVMSMRDGKVAAKRSYRKLVE